MPFSVRHITEFVRVNRRFRLEPVLVSNRAVPSLLMCKRALNKAGVSCVFHWVRSHFTKWCFVHTLGTQVVFRPLCSVSKRHFCKRSVARSYGSTELSTENTCTQGPSSHFSTRVQGLDLLFCCALVQRNQKRNLVITWQPSHPAKRIQPAACNQYLCFYFGVNQSERGRHARITIKKECHLDLL